MTALSTLATRFPSHQSEAEVSLLLCLQPVDLDQRFSEVDCHDGADSRVGNEQVVKGRIDAVQNDLLGSQGSQNNAYFWDGAAATSLFY